MSLPPLSSLAAAKVATVYIPIVYGDIVDAFETGENEVVILPVALIIAFGGLRVLSIAFAELRDAVFTKVAQRAIRDVALQTFQHLHSLALRYHLERQTGGLSHAIERGTKGIDFLLRFMLFNILPTLLEIALVCGILWGLFSFWYAFVTFISIVVYIAYTMIVTEWRLKWRREMNETDQRANTRAIDSLLNYETVKYFGNEEFEADRYNSALKRYERASIVSNVSLSLLNIGQALIIGVGLTIIVLMAGRDVVAGTMTIGEFVMVNTYLIQLYIPLNFLGYVYREIKQSLIDMEALFYLLTTNAEICDRDDAAPLPSGDGAVEFDKVSFGYDPRRQVLDNVSFRVEPGQRSQSLGPAVPENQQSVGCCFGFMTQTRVLLKLMGQMFALFNRPGLETLLVLCLKMRCFLMTQSTITLHMDDPARARLKLKRQRNLLPSMISLWRRQTDIRP